MSKLNRSYPTVAQSPIKTVPATRTVRTATGGPGYVNDAEGELFRLGVNALLGDESVFHEGGKARDNRFASLVRQVSVTNPQFIAGFLPWLRSEGNIRTASIMGAAHAVNARLEAGVNDDATVFGGDRGLNRTLIDMACQRADEPGELAAYWTGHFGRNLPKPVRRGLADAAGRLYNEYTAQKWDTASHAWRFADVLQMAHAAPEGFRHDLYEFIIADRYGNDFDLSEKNLPMIKANIALRQEAKTNPRVLLDASRLKAAGMTWEDTLSLAGTAIPKKDLWEALIDADQLGHMALIRNLRNIQEAKVSAQHIKLVQDRVADPAIVSKGRQFPFRYWSAYKNAGSDAWKYSLAQALDLSTQNIPELSGETYVFIDTSGSMQAPMSNDSKIYRVEAAALFAHALAAKNTGRVRVFEFADSCREVDAVKPGASVLSAVDATNRRVGHVGYGTETQKSVQNVLRQYGSPARIVIFTDCQSFGSTYYGANLDNIIPADVWTYAFDLAGYKVVDLPSGQGRRHQLAGLTDATFKMIPLLERGRNADWPWLAA